MNEGLGTPRTAGVVLAGGRSRRMGESKAAIDWFGTPLVARTASVLGSVCDVVVVVAAEGQELPDLPDGVSIVRDEQDDQGPLQGMASGMRALPDADRVFVAATDMPWLHPEMVHELLASLDDADVAAPTHEGRVYPLTAAYRASMLAVIDGLLNAGERRARAAVDAAPRAVLIPVAQLPHPATLRNVNTPEELAQARQQAASGHPPHPY